MPKYEYFVESIGKETGKELEEFLDEKGRKGWLLVWTSQKRYVFVREVSDAER